MCDKVLKDELVVLSWRVVLFGRGPVELGERGDEEGWGGVEGGEICGPEVLNERRIFF